MTIRWATVLGLAFVLPAAAAACGGDDTSLFAVGPGQDAATDVTLTTDAGYDGPSLLGDGALPDGPALLLSITPAGAVVNVNVGQPLPTLTYHAFAGGQEVPVSWSIDRGELGTITAAGGVLTPAGTIGGAANVSATWSGQTVQTTVTINLHAVQNGDPNAGDAGAADSGGAGGNGGVGGEGPGGAVSGPTQQVLQGVPTADPALAFLYPYDATVWPRGVLPPLLQWSAGTHNFDAVYIHISETNYDYQGFFAKTATPFVHHPVEQAAWKAMAYSNGGEDVSVTLVFAEGGAAYGPITQKWKVAKGTLKGTVYYNSYGTNLAHNFCCTVNNTKFGGATLAIKGNSTDPVLVAGNDNDCRVCHSVAANGAKLITQQASNSVTSAYDLVNGNAETVMSPADSRFAWGGLFPDGTFMFSNSAPQQGGNSTMPSALYAVPSGAPITATGVPAGLQAACPTFSPDGKHVAYNAYGGPSADKKSLGVMDFTQATNAFANVSSVYTPATGTAVWPNFLPTNDGLVFELETVNNGRDFGGTRSGCDNGGACSDSGTRAELWWVDLKTKMAARLDKANGAGYLPQGPSAHDQDATLNYEPTMNPVASGGYAWVVFTSRRLYGNVATINPYWSDPRYHDLSVTPTPKKLWVAAIDLNAPPGADPSHPAFYLPAQELLAGNSRGYWVVDPCHMNGTSCETGDECCGGYCRTGDAGLMCTDQTMGCAQEYEKCATSSDCCGAALGIQCINGRCAQQTPK